MGSDSRHRVPFRGDGGWAARGRVIGLKANRIKGHRVWPSRWTATIILLSALVVTSLPVRIDLFMIAALMWFSPVEGVRGAAAPATAKRDDEGRAQA